MKIKVTKDADIRGDKATPKVNASFSLKAAERPQTLRAWVCKLAVEMGVATEYKPRTKKKKESGE